MANQPKKYTKFVATAATATLVASAIVPVASAASFTDVAETNSHAENINALVEAGIIKGFEDGTFKPGQELTRGQVVKMLGKWVEAQGVTAPADFATKARFTDVAVDAKDQELVKYAALVADAKVFNGSNGVLNASGKISRENMALVLDRAYAAINETSLVALAADIEDVKVADLATAKKEAQEAIQALRDLGISGVENFNPKANVTRGQFASFLNKTINTEAKEVELTLTSAVATSATTLEVVLSDESKHEVKLEKALEANKETEVTFSINEKEYTAKVTYVLEVKAATVVDATTLEVVLTDDTKHTVKLEKALEANKATEVTFTIDAVEYKATVTYVVTAPTIEVLNSKQILVNFNKEVGNGADVENNYSVLEVANGSANAVASAQVQADGKSVVLTLTNAYRVSTDVAVTVNNVYVKGSIKETFPKFSKVVTINDTVAPALVKVTSKTNTTTAQTATVEFSEPIVSGAIFKVNGEVVTATPDATRSVYTLSGLKLTAGKEHTLEVINVADNADNKVAIITNKFTVATDATVATGKVGTIQDNKVTVTFDKVVNEASLNNVDILRYDATTKSYVPVALATTAFGLDKTGKLATFYVNASEKAEFFGANDNKEELIVKVKTGVIDSVGNQVAVFEEKATVSEDVTGPAFESVTFAKNSKGEVETLYFHFDEELSTSAVTAANLLAKVSVTDNKTNVTTDFETIFGTVTDADITVATDAKTIIVKPTTVVTNGSYNFTVAADLVADAAFAQNNNKKGTKSVNFGTVTNEVTAKATVVTSAITNEVTVAFSKAVTTESAKNPANYAINGVALTADTKVVVVDDKTVTFVIPEGTIAKTDNSAVVTVSNIKPLDTTSTFKSSVDTIVALDNTAPTAVASVLSNGLIQLTFSEAVTIDTTDFAKVTVNGKEVTTFVAEASSLLDGSAVAVLAVKAEIEEDFNTTGFSYLYIDTDGVAGFDPSKDIVLDQVKDVTAPAEWTEVSFGTATNVNVADLAAVSTVTVTLADTTATEDASDYKGGNVIKAGSIIKVK